MGVPGGVTLTREGTCGRKGGAYAEGRSKPTAWGRLLPSHPPRPLPSAGLGVGPAALPTMSAVQPPEDVLPALPTRPDVDRGMAPVPALMDGLIAFKIMTTECGLARAVTSLSAVLGPFLRVNVGERE